MSDRSRVSFYGVCGAYLLYMSYQLFKTVMEYGIKEAMVSFVVGIIFLVGGIGILFMTFKVSRKIRKEEKEAKALEEAEVQEPVEAEAEVQESEEAEAEVQESEEAEAEVQESEEAEVEVREPAEEEEEDVQAPEEEAEIEEPGKVSI